MKDDGTCSERQHTCPVCVMEDRWRLKNRWVDSEEKVEIPAHFFARISQRSQRLVNLTRAGWSFSISTIRSGPTAYISFWGVIHSFATRICLCCWVQAVSEIIFFSSRVMWIISFYQIRQFAQRTRCPPDFSNQMSGDLGGYVWRVKKPQYSRGQNVCKERS